MSEKILERIAISNFNYRRWSFGYFLESVKKLGLKNIELCGCHPHFTSFEAEEFPTRELAEQICWLYLTHPGVDADGIMRKMGI